MLYERFRNLEQDGTVELYCRKYAICIGHLKVKTPQLSDEYFVESFISGLQDEIKQVLKLLSPSSVEGAFKRAKYCAQGNKILQTRKAGGKQSAVMEVNAGSKGELSPMQEVSNVHSEMRGDGVDFGESPGHRGPAKNIGRKGDKEQSFREARRDGQQVVKVEKPNSVITKIKPEVVADEDRKFRIQSLQ